MSIFTNKFLSVAGQKERLRNVAGTLEAAFNPFSKSKVNANIANPTLKKVVQTIAQHPYTAAGMYATAATPAARALVGQGAKYVATQAAKGVVAHPLKSLVIGSVGTGILVASPTARKTIAKEPGVLYEAGKTIGGGIEDYVSGNKKIGRKEIVGGLAAAGVTGALIAGGVKAYDYLKNKEPQINDVAAMLPKIPVTPSNLPVSGEIPTAEAAVTNGNGYKAKDFIRINNKPQVNVVVQNLMRQKR